MLTQMQIIVITMSFSLAIVCSSYTMISRTDRSWINWATPWFFFSVATNYILQFGRLLLFEPTGSLYANVYCYATYAGIFLAAAVSYRWLKPIRFVRWTRVSCPEIKMLPWALVLLGIALYTPILIEFSGLWLHPREIYIQTRTGYGVWFFGSSFAVNLAFVIYLFKSEKTRLGTITFFSCCAIIIFLHGSKGQIVTLLMIWVLYRIYVDGKSLTARRALLTGGMIALILFAAFAMFQSTVENIQDLLESLLRYSDYTQNAMIVIDDTNVDRHWGKLLLENEFYSRVPRAIVPDKPKNFGEFSLAERYYPDWFDSDTGSPSFGIGFQYADFGPFTIFLLMAWYALTAWLAKSLIAILRLRPHPSYFIVLLLFCGIEMMPLGEGFLLPETVTLAVAISILLRLRVIPKVQLPIPSVDESNTDQL